jgi:hypothetical protein
MGATLGREVERPRVLRIPHAVFHRVIQQAPGAVIFGLRTRKPDYELECHPASRRFSEDCEPPAWQ